MLPDSTLRLLRGGYGFLPDRRRSAGRDVVDFRLVGRRVVAASGPRWARALYDEELFEREPAMPEPVRSTLVGQGAVHTVDGAEHRHRKQAFHAALTPDHVDSLVSQVVEAWKHRAGGWSRRGTVVLFDEAARVLLDGAWTWAGLPTDAVDLDAVADDMVAMVDGFGGVGPRNVRARAARRRTERLVEGAVTRVRAGDLAVDDDSPLARMAFLTDPSGEPVPARLAAVELLNLVRPTVAVAWFVAFAAHAIHRRPDLRPLLAAGDTEQVRSVVHELRRFYPFAPFVGAVAREPMIWSGVNIEPGGLVLLDIYGQHHDATLWDHPYTFVGERFLGTEPDPFLLIPQGAGDPVIGHRCPGEPAVVALLTTVLPLLARTRYAVPTQDLRIPLGRIPTRPADRMVLDVT